jgi:hypothetical protein
MWLSRVKCVHMMHMWPFRFFAFETTGQNNSTSVSAATYKAIIVVRYHSRGSMKLNACNCSSHTWFIYNLNTILLLAAFTQYHNTYTQINDAKPWRNPLLIPLANSLCWFPLTIPLSPESLLLSWNPSSLRGAILVHPGPRLLVNWPPPSHCLPIPISHPPRVSPNQLCALLRQHHDTDFI